MGGTANQSRGRTEIAFTKMVASGNDFIVVDNRDQALRGDLRPLFARICERKSSVGADGVLLLERDQELAFSMRYYNRDGSEAEMCGNGARCVALYACAKSIAPPEMCFSSRVGSHFASVSGNQVRIKLSDPTDLRLGIALTVEGRRVVCDLVNTGVPHAVLFSPDVEQADVALIGSRIRFHPELCSEGGNVNFVETTGRNSIKVRTYERGVEGETLSCGTGAVASAIVSYLRGEAAPPVEVRTQGGLLIVDFRVQEGEVGEVYLEGEARIAYEGRIELATETC